MADKIKVPPHSLEAEQSVLGACLLDKDAVVAVVESLRPPHFYEQRHGDIFAAILDLYQDRQPIDVVSVAEKLKKQKQLTTAGGAKYLTELVNRVPTAGHAEHYAQIVKDDYTKRQLISAAAKITEMAFDEGGDVRQILDSAESNVFSLAQQHLKQVFVPVKDILASSFDRLDELHKTAGSIRGVPTGFAELDDTLAGLQNSNLLILAARPGIGKCVTGETLIIDPNTGKREMISDLVSKKEGKVFSLNSGYKLESVTPSAFIDDGEKPVYELTTALGNKLEATAIHPLLTIEGWKKLEDLKEGDRIAVPRQLDSFGNEVWEDWRVKSLAYFLGDGGLTNSTPRFTNSNPTVLHDFASSVKGFGDIKVDFEKQSDLRQRTPTLTVVNKDRYHKTLRSIFSTRIKTWLASSGWSQRKLALTLGVSPSLVYLWSSGNSLPGLTTYQKLEALWGNEVSVADNVNPVTQWLTEIGIMGKLATQKSIPDEVFTLNRGNISLFLNRLYACEGSVILNKTKGAGIISFASSSYQMAEQVKHLLLRFRIIAKLRGKKVRYSRDFKQAYEVEILGSGDILTFAREIGIFGKEKKLERLVQVATLKNSSKNFSKDTLPMQVWKLVLKEKDNLSWREVYRRMGRPLSHNIHVNRRELRRETLKEIAVALNSQKLLYLAESDLFWDRVVSIKPVGRKQVYDLTINNLHNFVANDIVVHNTAFALNIAQNVAFKYKMPVGFFSLEMSREELMDRMLVSQAEIDAWKLKTGRLDEDEFTKLSDAMGELYETPLFIDDTPGISILEMRTKARRLQSENNLRLIVVDYLQLARPVRNLDNRVQEVSEISQGLKNLARELKIPVLALSQLSRQVESRGIKKPQLADLRESGAIEQDADVVMFMWRENDEDLENMTLDIAKHRNGPLRSLKLRFKPHMIKFFSVETKRKST